MSSYDKEKIFDKLRSYHVNTFPAKPASEELGYLREQFEMLQDQIINMILSFISGKAEFADSSKELASFEHRVQIEPKGDRREDAERHLFTEKIAQLMEVLEMAKGSTFKLRTRPAKVR